VVYSLHAIGAAHWKPGLTDDGACGWLTESRECAHYDDRPELCRVDDMRPEFVSPERWHSINAEHCNSMQEADGIAEPYRVRLTVL
jgi:Fe-S-cluster containining protein